MRGASLIVTGARGFIGSAVEAAAAKRDVFVVPLSRDGFDYTDLTAARNVLRQYQPQAVLHCAGAADVGASWTEPTADRNSVVGPLATMLEAARRNDAQVRVVVVSSGSVYGQPAHLPITERSERRPISPYGFHRKQAELLAEEYAAMFSVDVTVARVFSTFGPGQRRLLVWELAAQLLAGNTTLTLRGTGRERRDYLFVDDVASVLCDLALDGTGGHREVNVASGHSVTTLELATELLKVSGLKRTITCLDAAADGHPTEWSVDATLVRSVTSGVPRTLADGLRASWEIWADVGGSSR